jgi:hypothetical protein
MKDASQGILVSFYLGLSTDNLGRRLDEIQAWDNEKLENVHDYIQWLFPLKERSNFNPDAPILSAGQIAAFRSSDVLKARLLKSLKVMLRFYGLCCEESGEGREILKSDEYPNRRRNWVNRGNHNYLRITRILTSLRLLGLEVYADAFLKSLERLYEEEGQLIGVTSLNYWRRSLQ